MATERSQPEGRASHCDERHGIVRARLVDLHPRAFQRASGRVAAGEAAVCCARAGHLRLRVVAGGPHRPRHGERSRSQLHFRLGGTENSLILAVNVLAVNFWLLTSQKVSYTRYIVSKSVLYTLYIVLHTLSVLL